MCAEVPVLAYGNFDHDVQSSAFSKPGVSVPGNRADPFTKEAKIVTSQSSLLYAPNVKEGTQRLDKTSESYWFANGTNHN